MIKIKEEKVMPIVYDGVPKEVEILFEGQKLVFKVRNLSWSAMNQILSKCSSFTQDKKAIFDLDLYYREALIAMVVGTPTTPPFNGGPLTHALLVSLSPEFGSKLEELVPLPGATGQSPFVSGQP